MWIPKHNLYTNIIMLLKAIHRPSKTLTTIYLINNIPQAYFDIIYNYLLDYKYSVDTTDLLLYQGSKISPLQILKSQSLKLTEI